MRCNTCPYLMPNALPVLSLRFLDFLGPCSLFKHEFFSCFHPLLPNQMVIFSLTRENKTATPSVFFRNEQTYPRRSERVRVPSVSCSANSGVLACPGSLSGLYCLEYCGTSLILSAWWVTHRLGYQWSAADGNHLLQRHSHLIGRRCRQERTGSDNHR